MTQTERHWSDFEGQWTLERSIEQAALPPGRFEGRAVWSPHPEGLLYREEGTLHITGQGAMQATRSYLWKRDLSVWFEDGRYFHTVPPAGGDTAHWCDPDDYKVRYDFSGWPQFDVTWRVKGPRKAYEMRSRYTRIPAEG